MSQSFATSQRLRSQTLCSKEKKVISDKMTAEKKQMVCKYFNSGYCKFSGDCKYAHPKENCESSGCKNKECYKRHPKECRYGNKCRRESSCLYKHDTSASPCPSILSAELEDIKSLKVDIESLKKENTEKQTKLSMLADEIEEFKKNGVEKD